MCMFCGYDKESEATTTHTVDHGDYLIVIRNVPCMQCDKCEGQYYSYDVMKRLEQIIAEAKKLAGSIHILNYTSAA